MHHYQAYTQKQSAINNKIKKSCDEKSKVGIEESRACEQEEKGHEASQGQDAEVAEGDDLIYNHLI